MNDQNTADETTPELRSQTIPQDKIGIEPLSAGLETEPDERIYVRLTGSAIFGQDGQGRIAIDFLDETVNPSKEAIIFANKVVKALSVDIIIEFTPELFEEYQASPYNLNLEPHRIEETKDNEEEMNPSGKPGGSLQLLPKWELQKALRKG